MMAIEGVDYAFPPIPSATALKAAGKRFVARYGGPGSAGKQLTAAELAALTEAGIAVVANAEGTADGLLGGYATGRSWAADAQRYFRALGMPADRPIYLSVDFDANSTHWPALDAAMAGAASVLGGERVGVYGGYRVIEHFASAKDRVATWYWQTYAWSTISGSVRWHPAAHVQQYLNGVTIDGADCDLNRAMVTDYGQWTTGDDMDTPVTWNTGWIVQRLAENADPIVIPPNPAIGAPGATLPNELARALAALQATVDALTIPAPAPVDPAALKAVLLDPQVLAAIAKAVVDEERNRLES
jgi:Rv2525c-like, glycoside hydrolase-like domain